MMTITVTVMLSVAILSLLGALVIQNAKIEALTKEFDVYKEATEYTENKLIGKTQALDDKLNTRTHELDDMYQSMNARLNKHMIEHMMKGWL